MVESDEIIVLESLLAHKAEGDGAACRRKKRWWQLSESVDEARGCLICKNRSKYIMKVWLKDNSFCLHEFPIPGKAIILRHNMKSEWKSLFIASIVESSECTKENQKSLTLSFSSVNDFSRWEKELRGNLKVYSCNVEIEQNQTLPEGPAVVHVTSDYIYITADNDGRRYKSLYCKNMRKNSVVCYSDDSEMSHFLAIKNRNGCCETIKFKSKNVSVIKKSLNFLANLPVGKKLSTERCSNGETVKMNKNTDQVIPVVKSENRAVVHKWYSRNEIRCYETAAVKSGERSTYQGLVRSGSPCLYSYVSVDCDLSSEDAQETNQPTIKVTDFQPLSKTEEERKCKRSCVERAGENTDVFSIQEEENRILHSSKKRETREKIGKRSEESCSVDYDRLNMQNDKPTKSVVDFKTTTMKCGPECTKTGGCLSSDYGYNDNEYEKIGKAQDTKPCKPMSQIEIYKYSDEPLVLCRSSRAENIGSLSISASNPLIDNLDSPTKTDVYDHLNRSCSDRRTSRLEDWTPKGLPPIFKREHPGSPNPENHWYQNGGCGSPNAFNEGFRKDPIEIFVLLYANGMTSGGVWTIGVLVVKSQDNETFKLIQDLENDFGRKQLCTPRLLDAETDIAVGIKECSDGFDVINNKSQILRYDDLEKLGQRRWIVVEFLFEHRDEESSIFKCDFSIEPAQGENRESHFSSQNISIVKKFSTSGSVENIQRKSTPPRSRLRISTLNRQELCRDLDITVALGNDWKEFAARIGLETREICIIEHAKCSSCTEEVLQILERRYPEKCNLEYLKTVLLEMRRRDLIEYLE